VDHETRVSQTAVGKDLVILQNMGKIRLHFFNFKRQQNLTYSRWDTE